MITTWLCLSGPLIKTKKQQNKKFEKSESSNIKTNATSTTTTTSNGLLFLTQTKM